MLQFGARRRIGGGEAAERFVDLGCCPLRQRAVGGLGIGLAPRLAGLDARRFALAGGLQPSRAALLVFLRAIFPV